jgi:acetoin utilization deacetylase AcuC-like enzyme
LALVHDPAYIDIVRLLCAEGFTFIGSPDTGICPASYDVAALATGGVLAACDAVWRGDVRRAFCAVRPPGHHASIDQAQGFCLFNHVAIAAEYLIRHHGASRVAIVDFDAHHGNGTQAIFESRRDVLYVSLHERPEAPSYPGTGYASERGIGIGTGFTLNVPLDWGCSPGNYLRAVDEHVLPALAAYQPEWLLLSAGFDGLASDPVGHLGLQPDTFEQLTHRLLQTAGDVACDRVVSVLEGGYVSADLGAAVVAHLRALRQ